MLIDKSIFNFYQLAYSPGLTMSPQWWEVLNLASWKEVYSRSPECRQSVDALIQSRRGFATSSVSIPEAEWQLHVCREMERLPKLLAALGLIRLARLDYLLLRHYRESLLIYFEPHELMQLQAIYPDVQFIDEQIKVDVEPLSVSSLHSLALYLGWDGLQQSSIFWQVLALLFPPNFISTGVGQETRALMQQWFVRLRRLL